MKKLSAVIAISLILYSLSGCGIEGYDDGYEDGYEDGHYEGLCDGYYEGIEEAQRFLAAVVDEDLSSLGLDIEKQYGLHPEDALAILSNYADVPDEVDEEQLADAIWSIYRYYYDSQKVINGIEDYWID